MNYSPFRHIGSIVRKRRPIQFTFFVTRRCNARCHFCFYLSKNGNNRGCHELTLEEIEKISRSMRDLLWLAFSGGEIFLRDDLVDITKVFYDNNKPAIILLSTNGLLPEVVRDGTESILKECGRSTIAVKLSLDGPEELHDFLRGVKGAFRKTLETCRLLGELQDRYANLEVGINTLFCSANQDVMDDLLTFVQGMDHINTHTVSLIRGDIKDGTLKDVDIRKYEKTIKRMAHDLRTKNAKRYTFRGSRLKAAQDILQRRLTHDTWVGQKRLTPCYAGRLNLVLTEAGDVFACESFNNRMGNVKDTGYDMKKLLKSEDALRVVRSIRENTCYCTHECYMMTNILFNPERYPALFREYKKL